MQTLKKLPRGKSKLATIPEFLAQLEIGECVILSERTDWTHAMPLEHGVGLLIDGAWKLNGEHAMTGPEKWPDPNFEGHPAFLSQDGKTNGNGPAIDRQWKQFEGHPFGIMFHLADDSLVLMIG